MKKTRQARAEAGFLCPLWGHRYGENCSLNMRSDQE